MNIIVSINGVNVVPLRALPFILSWQSLTPREVTAALAGRRSDAPPEFRGFQAYRLEDGEVKVIAQHFWDNRVAAELELVSERAAAMSLSEAGRRHFMAEQELRVLPPAVFVKYDDFVQRLFTMLGDDGSFGRSVNSDEWAGGVVPSDDAGDLETPELTPILSESERLLITEGFEDHFARQRPGRAEFQEMWAVVRALQDNAQNQEDQVHAEQQLHWLRSVSDQQDQIVAERRFVIAQENARRTGIKDILPTLASQAAVHQITTRIDEGNARTQAMLAPVPAQQHIALPEASQLATEGIDGVHPTEKTLSASSWPLVEPLAHADALTDALHSFLKNERQAGRPRPTYGQIRKAWKTNPPPLVRVAARGIYFIDDEKVEQFRDDDIARDRYKTLVGQKKN